MTKQQSIIDKCREDFVINKCADPVPAAVEHCKEKELCMNMPIEVTVKTVNNVANLCAQTLNSFFSQLDYTTMAVLCFMLLLYFKYAVASMIALMSSSTPTKDSAA